MRTTVTLDDDLAQQILDLARDSRRPFKVVLNDLLRNGLGNKSPIDKPFRIHAHAGHLKPGFDPRKLNEFAWEPESH